MMRTTWKTLPVLAFAMAAWFSPLALGQVSGAFDSGVQKTYKSKIQDDAKLFSPEAIKSAEDELIKSELATGRATMILTVESLLGQPIEDMAIQSAKRMTDAQDLFLLISKKEHKISSLLVRKPLEPFFPVEKRLAMRDAIISAFKEKDFDDGLKRGVHLIAEALASIPARKADGTSGIASSGPIVERDRSRLTLAGARVALAAAEAKAIELGIKENIAVVDDGGHLLAFSRMDGARPASISTALAKASAAATSRQATGPLPDKSGEPAVLLNLALQDASGGKILSLLGGIPILIDGQTVGAVGVGGGTGEQDADVARAGASAFQKPGIETRGNGTADAPDVRK